MRQIYSKMIQRDIINDLEQWRNDDFRQPLILRGARQVGKTTTVMDFGRSFANFLHLNLEESDSAKRLFLAETDINSRLEQIFLYCGVVKKDGDTLLFIDEIQQSTKAIAMLRYFYEKRPDIHVIAAGSLLENVVDMNESFPVGRTQYLAMRPCSFKEFATAIGLGDKLGYSCEHPETSQSFHAELTDAFKRYLIVGGMPRAVAHYVARRDLTVVENDHRALLQAYRDDAEKYTRRGKMNDIVRLILQKGWTDAGKIVHLGNYGGTNHSAGDVKSACSLLSKAMLLELVYPTTSTLLPAWGETRRTPKLLWLDTGLVNYVAHIRSEIITAGNILDVWRGSIAEQVVGQELLAINNDIDHHRAFWSRGNGRDAAEVDFVWTHKSSLFPIEVKAGHNSHLRSLHSFIDRSPVTLAVRVWSNPFQVDDIFTTQGRKSFRLLSVPFYMVGNLDALIDRYS